MNDNVTEMHPPAANIRCACGDEWLTGGQVVFDVDGRPVAYSQGGWRCGSCGKAAGA